MGKRLGFGQLAGQPEFFLLTFDALRSGPAAFRSLTGMSVEDFDSLGDDFLLAQTTRPDRATRTGEGQPRRRTSDAGREPNQDDRHRLLMGLIWLRIDPTYERLGLLLHLHKGHTAMIEVEDTMAQSIGQVGHLEASMPEDLDATPRDALGVGDARRSPQPSRAEALKTDATG